MITLQQLLEARDNRQIRYRSLKADHPHDALTVLTVNIPGSEKRTPDSLLIARAGVEALREAFGASLKTVIENDLSTGFEAYFIASLTDEEAKRIAVGIESGHPLGRLMDIDIIGSDMRPISRTDLGDSPRKCLLCGNDARVCMRLRSHSVEEILAKIHSMVADYTNPIAGT